MDRPPRNQQQLLIDDQATGYRHRYCRKCGRPLVAQDSRLAGFGPDCDPNRLPRAAAVHQVEQEPLPGT
ncbi:DUF6011 domain-containing protein (plasmid) [Streptomyces sp. NBC_01005]|uniref:DUF6011 domain-containing protein n=1 Tax=Streptomyces sp. NBC_01005 TaxID=2903715 RepID=UPI003865AFC4|nr:DUF6011 domain-containing protein [Streptomyces sp. NBC_01005]